MIWEELYIFWQARNPICWFKGTRTCTPPHLSGSPAGWTLWWWYPCWCHSGPHWPCGCHKWCECGCSPNWPKSSWSHHELRFVLRSAANFPETQRQWGEPPRITLTKQHLCRTILNKNYFWEEIFLEYGINNIILYVSLTPMFYQCRADNTANSLQFYTLKTEIWIAFLFLGNPYMSKCIPCGSPL